MKERSHSTSWIPSKKQEEWQAPEGTGQTASWRDLNRNADKGASQGRDQQKLARCDVEICDRKLANLWAERMLQILRSSAASYFRLLTERMKIARNFGDG